MRVQEGEGTGAHSKCVLQQAPTAAMEPAALATAGSAWLACQKMGPL